MAIDADAPLSVADAIRDSGIARHFPDEDLSTREVGIWGRIVTRDTQLGDGDRVEIYRPLEQDPRDARRLRARAKIR